MEKDDKDNRIQDLADRVLSLARDSIIVRFRFFDRVLARIEITADETKSGYLSDAGKLTYNPVRLLRDCRDDQNFAVRLLLHVIFHNIFMHHLRDDKSNRKYWDIACDIAVENTVLAVCDSFSRLNDTDAKIVLSKLNKWIPHLTAEQIYAKFIVGGISEDSAAEYERLFSMDIHQTDETSDKEEIIISQQEWEKIARRVSAELKSFSKDIRGSDTIILNLGEGVRKRYDYDDIVRRFAVMNEEIKVNPDEFDYIYYMYGLTEYENMPLVEPLEYTDEKIIKEFVIAVDTSASVRGKTVKSFLERTYDLLASSTSFSESMKVHIIQCDSDVTADVIIKDRASLKEAAERMQVKGFGATDYRPVFEYVRQLREKRELAALKGLIYFTDGYGIYPAQPPGYDVMFAFDGQDDFRPPCPAWAMAVTLDNDSRSRS